MPTEYVTLITPDGEQVVTDATHHWPSGYTTIGLPWLQPRARMNGTWTIVETGEEFNIQLPYKETGNGH